MVKLEKVCTTNPNEFWKHLSKLGPKQKYTIPMEVYGDEGEILCDKDNVLKVWKNEFEKIYNDGYEAYNDGEWVKRAKATTAVQEEAMLDPLYTPNYTLNKDITIEEVRDVINKAKVKKSVGVDLIPNEIFKNGQITHLLQQLFQLCFDSGRLPNIWLQSIIKPIPKSKENDPRVPMNYRGISLISCTAKLFTGILNTRISSFLDENTELVDEQNGFRKKRSCTDHIFVLQSIIKSRQESNLDTFVSFIDFSKAFDRVNRESLLFKLLNNGSKIDGKMYFIVKSLYAYTESCINVNGNFTDWFRTLQGVKQGDNLSPTLFSIFINDLAKGLKQLNLGVKVGDEVIPILMYADDVAILSENAEDLQSMLDFTHQWCKKWGMTINMSKSKIIHFRKKGKECDQTTFKIGDKTVDYVQDNKYLGVFFDEHLDFSKHEKIMAESGSRALGALIAKYKNLQNMGFDTYKKCYDTSIYPILEYGSEVWGYHKGDSIENVHNKAIKVFLGVHRFAANLTVTGDMGWTPPSVKRKIAMIRYWNRLITMEDSRLTKRVFLTMHANNKTKWCRSLCEIMSETGIEENFWYRIPCDLKLCLDKLMETHIKKWKDLLPKKPKLRTYTTFKSHYFTENFIKINLDRNQRSVLSQLRCGILPLHIETGRFNNTKLEDRKCQICSTDAVESE